VDEDDTGENKERSTCSDNGKRRTELNKNGENIYIWGERQTQNEKKKKGDGLNNVRVIQKRGNNWTKERFNTLAST
jgi:hypothetical protein